MARVWLSRWFGDLAGIGPMLGYVPQSQHQAACGSCPLQSRCVSSTGQHAASCMQRRLLCSVCTACQLCLRASIRLPVARVLCRQGVSQALANMQPAACSHEHSEVNALHASCAMYDCLWLVSSADKVSLKHLPEYTASQLYSHAVAHFTRSSCCLKLLPWHKQCRSPRCFITYCRSKSQPAMHTLHLQRPVRLCHAELPGSVGGRQCQAAICLRDSAPAQDAPAQPLALRSWPASLCQAAAAEAPPKAQSKQQGKQQGKQP